MSTASSSCGFWCWHPKWLNRYANARWFMVIYGLLGTIQTTSFVYFAVTLSTIQKRFKIPSQTTGVILSGNEISQILLSLILAYYGGQRDRPRWIAWGILLGAFSCFILASPHFMYGAGDDAFQLTEEFLSMYQNNSIELLEVTTDTPLKESSKLCQIAADNDMNCVEIFSYVPLFLIFLSQFVLGVGNTLYLSLGQSYLDDSTHQKRSPMVFAYALAMRMIGPLVGFNISNWALKTYIDPSLTPFIDSDDPRWLGAWWLGWVLFGVVMMILSGFIAMFPENLKAVEDSERNGKANEVSVKKVEKEASFKDFKMSLKRILKNKLIMYNILSNVFYFNGGSVFATFLGRIMEVQFNKPITTTSFTGALSIVGIMFGFLLSGFIISKYNPPPKYLFFWNVFIGILVVGGQIGYSQLGCDTNNINLINGTLDSCNNNCYCDDISYTPICNIQTNETFFSPCHAGCKSFDPTNKLYTDCSCSSDQKVIFELPNLLPDSPANDELKRVGKILSSNIPEIMPKIQQFGEKLLHVSSTYTPGPCENDCTRDLIIFSLIGLCVSFISSTGKIGNILVDLRAIEPRDKSLTQGLSLFLISLLASIPAPIIYGRIIDSTCISWSFKCGGLGNCQLYDPKAFRQYLHLTGAVFTAIGVFFDVLVWRLGKNLDLYGDDADATQIDNKEAHALAECEPLNR